MLVDGESHQGHVAAVRQQLAQVGDFPAATHLDEQPSHAWIAAHLLQVDLVRGGRHDDLAVRRRQGALIVDGGRRHHDAAGSRRIDLRTRGNIDGDLLRLAVGTVTIHGPIASERGAAILVDHLGQAALERVLADLQRAGHQGVGIHPGVLAEHEAVLVDQIDLAVGADAAEDATGIALVDAVHGDRRGRGLAEAHAGVTSYVEALPVQNGAIGMLDHIQGVAVDRVLRPAQGGERLLGDRQLDGIPLCAKATGHRQGAADGEHQRLEWLRVHASTSVSIHRPPGSRRAGRPRRWYPPSPGDKPSPAR